MSMGYWEKRPKLWGLFMNAWRNGDVSHLLKSPEYKDKISYGKVKACAKRFGIRNKYKDQFD